MGEILGPNQAEPENEGRTWI